MKYIINLILNLCDCLQITVSEITNLILQPIFTVIRIFIQCADVFGFDIYPQENEAEESENNKHNKIGFIK